MPLSLRKACHACTRSKRRCVPRLPSCDRCAKKQIPCRYDLEPVSQGEVAPQFQQDVARSRTGNADDGGAEQDSKIVYHSVKSAREASVVAMADGYTPDSAATHPKVTGTPQLITWVLGFFSDVIHDARMGKGTPFVHAHILRKTPEEGDSTTKSDYTQRLSCVHDLTIQSLTLLLDKSAGKSDTELDTLVVQTFSSTHDLWSSPPRHFDDSFTPWETWLLAESIRRSMFAATFVKGLLSFLRTGYVTYEPFFESCPFDPRAGLWEANTAESWQARLEKHGGDHVSLKSYDEFIRGSETGLNPNEDGAFQRLLFTCYYFDAGLEYLERLGNVKQ